MTVNVQRRRNDAVTDPRLNIFRVITAFAERVHRRMSQFVEADGLGQMEGSICPKLWEYRIGTDLNQALAGGFLQSFP